GFNNGLITTTPNVIFTSTQATFDPSGRVGQGLLLQKVGGVPTTALQTSSFAVSPQRGTVSFWIRLNSTTLTGQGEIFSTTGDNNIGFVRGAFAAGSSGQITITPGFDGHFNGLGWGVSDQIATDTFNFMPGDWHHIIWTWQGTHHRLFRD